MSKLHYITFSAPIAENGIHKRTLCGIDKVEYGKATIWGVIKPFGVTCQNCKKIAKEIAN